LKLNHLATAGLTVFAIAATVRASIITTDPYALGGDRRYVMTPNSPNIGGYMSAGDLNIFFRINEFVMTGDSHAHPILGEGPSSGTSALAGSASFGVGDYPSNALFGFTSSSLSFTDYAVSGGFGSQGSNKFNTVIDQLDLRGASSLLPGSGEWMIRLSDSMQSGGSYSISDLGGGQYSITSFFDIYTEISFDGGLTWNPSVDSNGDIMAAHFELMTVPAPSVMAVLGVAGLGGRRRRVG
jgi:hypothetical protein